LRQLVAEKEQQLTKSAALALNDKPSLKKQ
jgi:hypothetical protein